MEDKNVISIRNIAFYFDINIGEEVTAVLKQQKKQDNLTVFIQAMKVRLNTTSFEKLSVGEIVKESGLSRQTFYRTCENKYDLVNKYLKKIIIETYSTIGVESTLQKSLEKKFRKMLPERDLLAVAFQSKEYDGLYQFTHRLIFDFHKNFIEKQEGRTLDPEEKYLLDMYCESSVYMTMKWATKEIEVGSTQMANLLVDAMPPKLQNVYKTVGQTE